MDKPTLERIQLLHPAVREEAEAIYKEICSRLTAKNTLVRFTFTLRTFAEQDKLYAQGRTAPGIIVTKAKGGQSWHNYGLAIDVAILVDKNGDGKYETLNNDLKADFDGDGMADFLEEIVYVFELYGWEAGIKWAKFPDPPHFQKTFGLTIAEAQKRYNEGKLIPNTNYIRLGNF